MFQDSKLQNFFLPLVAGAILAIPVFWLTHKEASAKAAPTVGKAQPELNCGPFAEAFAAMRAEADRIASLTSASMAPAEDVAPSPADWTEIHAAARALDAWVWEANSESAPLTAREAAVLSDAVPITGDIRWEVADIAGRLNRGTIDGPADQALLHDMQTVMQKAGAVARLLDPLVQCRQTGREYSYAPRQVCETLDPEYQFAMNGACIQ